MKRATQVNVLEAKTHLSKLLADVEQGREVIIARDGTPVARIIPFVAPAKKGLRVGDWRGRIKMTDDFDRPLSARELKAWGF